MGIRATSTEARAGRPKPPKPDSYAWIALANTTAAIFMASLDGSVVIIALPAIFRGINLDPLSAGNISYLLWMIMGYRLVQAVLVVNLGKLGDMFGRVKMYNAGFVVFTIASVLLSFDPFEGTHGAIVKTTNPALYIFTRPNMSPSLPRFTTRTAWTSR